MLDEQYLRGRAAAAHRMAEAARSPEIRFIHQELARSYQARADALAVGGRDRRPA